MRYSLPAFVLAIGAVAITAVLLGGSGASAQANSVTITMAAGRDGNQTGTATLTNTAGGLQVVVNITPYSDPQASQLAHIHTGQCPNVGGVANALTSIVNGQSTTTLSGVTLASVQTGGFAINVHDPNNPALYTSCGNIAALQATATPTATPTPTGAATATRTATPASVPQTGGPADGGGTSALTYAALALSLSAIAAAAVLGLRRYS